MKTRTIKNVIKPETHFYGAFLILNSNKSRNSSRISKYKTSGKMRFINCQFVNSIEKSIRFHIPENVVTAKADEMMRRHLGNQKTNSKTRTEFSDSAV